MTRQIEIEIEKLLSIMPIGLKFTTKWFKDTLHGLYGRSRDSYIPSDYCENISNKDNERKKYRSIYFKALEGLGEYQFIGISRKEQDK